MNMDKIQSLHKMLDQQINGIHQQSEAKSKTFHHLEHQLQQLQIKLSNIKTESQLSCQKIRPNIFKKSSNKPSSNHPCQNDHKTPLKKSLLNYDHPQPAQSLEKNKQAEQSKLLSSVKKSRKNITLSKKESSCKKQLKRGEYNSWKSLRMGVKDGKEKDSKRVWKKINECEKQNKMLKEKVKELKVFEKEYYRMKEMFQKSQLLKRKTRFK